MSALIQFNSVPFPSPSSYLKGRALSLSKDKNSSLVKHLCSISPVRYSSSNLIGSAIAETE